MAQIQASNLPSDIISEIFKNFSTRLLIHQGPISDFPWFRIVFLSMSAHFWENPKIDFSRTTKIFPLSVPYFERAFDVLKFCLKCNEGCPLSFYFRMGTDIMTYTEEYIYVMDILDALLAQSMRWVKAFLWVQAPEVSRLNHIKGRVPLLQSLVFAQKEPSNDWEDGSMAIDPGFARFVNAFEDSPSLTRVRLYISNIKGWKLDRSSIVVLRLQLSNADGLVAALWQSMRLEVLQVTSGRPGVSILG